MQQLVRRFYKGYLQGPYHACSMGNSLSITVKTPTHPRGFVMEKEQSGQRGWGIGGSEVINFIMKCSCLSQFFPWFHFLDPGKRNTKLLVRFYLYKCKFGMSQQNNTNLVQSLGMLSNATPGRDQSNQIIMAVRILTEFASFFSVIFNYSSDTVCLIAHRFFSFKNSRILHVENICMQSSFSITKLAIGQTLNEKLKMLKKRKSASFLGTFLRITRAVCPTRALGCSLNRR